MANEQNERIHLCPTEGFVSKQVTPRKFKLVVRNHHTRAIAGRGGVIRVVETEPDMCPLCHTRREESVPVEIQKDGKWWWHCQVPECGHDWDPV